MGSVCVVHLPFEVMKSRHGDDSVSKDQICPSSHDKSSSSCMTARSSAARTRNTHLCDCSERAPAVICYCLVDLHKLSALDLPLHLSSPVYCTTAQSYPARPSQSNPTTWRPLHLSLQPTTPPWAPSSACETETTPSSPVTQHSLPQPPMPDLRSQNMPPQRSPKPTLS